MRLTYVSNACIPICKHKISKNNSLTRNQITHTMKKRCQRRKLVIVTSNTCCQWHVNKMTREHEQQQQQKLTFLMRRPKINQHPVQKMVQITASSAQMQQKIISKFRLALLSQMMSLQLQMHPRIYYMWYRLKVKVKGTCTWFWGRWGTRSTFRRTNRGRIWN